MTQALVQLMASEIEKNGWQFRSVAQLRTRVWDSPKTVPLLSLSGYASPETFHHCLDSIEQAIFSFSRASKTLTPPEEAPQPESPEEPTPDPPEEPSREPSEIPTPEPPEEPKGEQPEEPKKKRAKPNMEPTLTERPCAMRPIDELQQQVEDLVEEASGSQAPVVPAVAKSCMFQTR